MQRHRPNGSRRDLLKRVAMGSLALGLVGVISAALLIALALDWQRPNLPRRDLPPQASLGEILATGLVSQEGGEQRLTLSTAEINAALAATLRLAGLPESWRSSADLDRDKLTFTATGPLFGESAPYLRLSFSAEATSEALPMPSSIQIGSISLPRSLARWLGAGLVRQTPRLQRESWPEALQEVTAAFRSLEVQPSYASAAFEWDRAALDRLSWDLQRGVVSPAALAASSRYSAALRNILSSLPSTQRAVALSNLLPGLARLAHEQTQAGSDPVLENTALLYALSAHLAGREGLANDPEIRLRRRQDLAQHVVNSAAITAVAGAEVAEIISTGKEAFDARYRSGFSFSDLTANRVGIRLAMLATDTQASAREFQRRLLTLKGDAQLIPGVGDSRDGLSQSEFEAQYRSRSSSEYQKRLDAIDSELSQLALFRD